jgi:nicotinate-nucleotide adenylyltransferase
MIILYGGSFNPPTLAHYEISKYLIEKYNPQEFIFIPVGNVYDKNALVDFKHRYQMLKIIANKLPKTIVSDYESQKEYQGTIATLDYFQDQYPTESLYYVIGADNLLTIKTWIDYERLISLYKFIVFNRDNINSAHFIKTQIPKNYQSAFIQENTFPNLAISSSLYRNEKKANIVLKEINDYIYKHHLYMR